ncbi:MAG: flavoprotein [Candidatus Omnitrophota bacterium]|jgi:phosphopantothenoylcysteine decarboxylase/phosphopantothenate--cysteine ligase
MSSARKTVIVGVTASIAAYKACEIVNLLRKDSFDVKVILTKDALEFVTPLTLQTLSGNKVMTGIFESPENWTPVHTSLADSASLILIAPATANIIGKLANGICDDLLTCVTCASRSPVLIAPAMNENMYNHKMVMANIAKLEKIGYKFVGPVKGHLACGYDAIGHIAPVAEIIKEAKKMIK